MGLSDFKVSNSEGFRYIFVRIDNFSEYAWLIPLKNKISQTMADELSNFLATSKRRPVKL